MLPFSFFSPLCYFFISFKLDLHPACFMSLEKACKIPISYSTHLYTTNGCRRLRHENNVLDHVSYRVPRPIHGPMHQSIYRSLLDQTSTCTQPVCWLTVDREWTDVLVELPLMSAEVLTMTISGANRSTTGGILVNYRRNVSLVSFDSRVRVYRYYRPIYRPILDTIYQMNISTDTNDWYINRYFILYIYTIDHCIDWY